MRIQAFVMCVAIAVMTLFSPMSGAACDADCQGAATMASGPACDDACNTAAVLAGQDAANELAAHALGKDGEVGKLARTEAMLEACGEKEKTAAVRKARRALTTKLANAKLEALVHDPPADLGNNFAVAIGSFMSRSDGIASGYVLGYGEMASLAFSLDKPVREHAC